MAVDYRNRRTSAHLIRRISVRQTSSRQTSIRRMSRCLIPRIPSGAGAALAGVTAPEDRRPAVVTMSRSTLVVRITGSLNEIVITFVEVAALLVPLYILIIDIHRTIGRFQNRIETNEDDIEELEQTVAEHQEQLNYLDRYE
jgi:hypothetical protein